MKTFFRIMSLLYTIIAVGLFFLIHDYPAEFSVGTTLLLATLSFLAGSSLVMANSIHPYPIDDFEKLDNGKCYTFISEVSGVLLLRCESDKGLVDMFAVKDFKRPDNLKVGVSFKKISAEKMIIF